MAGRMENLVLEGARLMWRNFAGKGGTYNQPGNRNFCVRIDDPNTAQKLISQGWNVRPLQSRDPDDEPRYYIQVKVQFGDYPPRIYTLSGKHYDETGAVKYKHKTLIGEDAVQELDTAEFDNVDLVISPYAWEMNGRTGVKAYLKTMYATLAEDDFSNKYAVDDEELPFN